MTIAKKIHIEIRKQKTYICRKRSPKEDSRAKIAKTPHENSNNLYSIKRCSMNMTGKSIFEHVGTQKLL